MTEARALVTGGTGFLGGHLARRLQTSGWDVTAVGRNTKNGAALAADEIRFRTVDLRDPQAVEAVCSGMDTVFHCAALSSPWGRYQDFFASNVEATRHIIHACQRQGVRRLVNVSTPSLYFDFSDRLGIRETDPLPASAPNAYAATKRIAEEEVLAAHNPSFESVSLRPRALFGPGDTAILPRLIHANDRIGVPLFRRGEAILDLTYVDNAVDALLLAAEAPPAAMGRTYNITNGEPVRLADVLHKLFDRLGVPMRGRPIPYSAGYMLAGAMELAARLLPGQPEPLLTRYTIALLAKSQTLDISAARQWLRYSPRIPNDEGIARFADWWRNPR
ncbi:NAD-dependent epimerase/dehydratase family protein [Paenibacillus mendelii]|uniref:NAD-dependent epimerase/dehydratase family protein n=1 Tax=Paenibacillus mendelii TaxID=206163 RepID=A0ABV6JG07_9BACL|nr:NAD-dependent epimerase/dehydratase family protein [Paenibacillus mendelii]MCQ6557723.1 NAD-dependent epimerase/dehydratase family protein [Paenibacillus mendelii]